ERGLEWAARLGIDDPPAHDRARTAPGAINELFDGVDVHAPEQRALALVEHRVVEGEPAGDLLLVAHEVLTVLLERHVRPGPAPRVAVLRPQAVTGTHDRRVVELDVGSPDRAQMVARREVESLRSGEIVR